MNLLLQITKTEVILIIKRNCYRYVLELEWKKSRSNDRSVKEETMTNLLRWRMPLDKNEELIIDFLR